MLGMIALSVEQRKKEIGIRKILGASIPNLVLLLSNDTTKHLLMANLIVWPIAYHLTQQWLQNFAYQITLGLQPFVLGSTLITLVIFLTISTPAPRIG
jgi:putative ABC transport system permease protein